MSYITCTYCWKRGHNKLGCPERKAYAKANPDSPEARAMLAEKETRKRAVANRRCSYCGDTSHNRRSCNPLKQDKALVLEKNKEYRKHFLNELSKAGLGPGAIVCSASGDYYREPGVSVWSKNVTMMLTSIEESMIDFLQAPVLRPDGELTEVPYKCHSRTLIFGRVIKADGYMNGGGRVKSTYWRETLSRPEQNKLYPVVGYDVSCILPDELPTIFDRKPTGQENSLKILSPSFKPWTISEEQENELTPHLNDTFHFNPDKNATDWEKGQLHPLTGAWLYPDRERVIKAYEERERLERRIQNESI